MDGVGTVGLQEREGGPRGDTRYWGDCHRKAEQKVPAAGCPCCLLDRVT